MPGIIPGRNVDKDLTGSRKLEPDFCIVGSGASGGVCALKLAEAGFDIVVLEEGPDIPLKTGHGGPCHKRGLLRKRESLMCRLLYQEGAGRITQDGGILVLQGRCLGGGTAVNWSACLPLPTSLFNGGSKTTACRLRALDFVPTFRKLSITSTFIIRSLQLLGVQAYPRLRQARTYVQESAEQYAQMPRMRIVWNGLSLWQQAKRLR